VGIDISLTMGVGFHIPPDDSEFLEWIEDMDPHGAGAWEVMEEVLKDYDGFSFDWPGNAWTGIDNGWVVYTNGSAGHMQREVEAGVYRPAGKAITLHQREVLKDLSRMMTGKELPIEALVMIGVS
jgi:hypothetical protein